MEKVRAFIIVFDSLLKLQPGKSFVVTFRTPTEDIQDEDDFFARAAYENATNRYYYMTAKNRLPMDSNPVHVTLIDGKVSVEGDLWIDEDWSGTQKHYRDYNGYQIIENLKSSLSFHLTENRVPVIHDKEPDQGGTNTSIGESIKHFKFTNLFPAYHLASWPLYTLAGEDDIDSTLNISLSMRTTTMSEPS